MWVLRIKLGPLQDQPVLLAAEPVPSPLAGLNAGFVSLLPAGSDSEFAEYLGGFDSTFWKYSAGQVSSGHICGNYFESTKGVVHKSWKSGAPGCCFNSFFLNRLLPLLSDHTICFPSSLFLLSLKCCH